MILSNVSIHKALDAADIVIRPEPGPRLSSLDHPKSPYGTTSVDLGLSADLSISVEQPMAFDLRKPGLAKFIARNYRPAVIDEDGGYSLKPNQFVLGQTVEWLELPIRKGRPVYCARVEGRSSFARCGLLVHFTAPTIHAGFEGHITFEILNLGDQDILLTRDLKIGQLIFEEVQGLPKRNDSQFQHQKTPAGTRAKAARK